MANDKSLTVSLFGRDITLSKTLNDVGTSAKTTRDHLNDAAKVAAGAFAAVSGAALVAAKAAAEDQQSATQLANTLHNVVGANTAVTKSVENYISKATLASGIADDQLRPAFQRLVTSTKNVEESQKLTNLAMEIATAKHMDVTAVANALAKAHDGNMGALKRLGITLDETTVKNKDFGAAVDELGKTFKGSLQANAETAAGKMAIMKNAFNEAKESVGYSFLPILGKFADMLKSITPFITQHSDAIGKVMMVVGGLAGAVLAVNAAFKIWEATTKAFTIVQTALNVVLNMNPIGAVIIAVTALVAAIVLAYQHSEKFRDIVNGAWQMVKETVGTVVDWLKEAMDFVSNLFENAGKIIMTGFKIYFGVIKAEINGVISLVNLAIRALNNIHFTVPSWIPGLGGKSFGVSLPQIPMLADGGIVTKPTIAMIGEAGPEAVVPLNKGFGSGVNVVINVHGSVVQEQDLAVSVRDQIAILMRRRGLNPSILGV